MVFKSCGGILELQREIQTSSCVGPVKTNLPFELRGRDGCCSRVTVGQNRPHLGFCPGHNVPLQGQQGSRGCIPDSPKVRPHLEGKQSTLLSSQVATGISWSPLSGLKGVKPPVKFGEKTRDCSPGQAGPSDNDRFQNLIKKRQTAFPVSPKRDGRGRFFIKISHFLPFLEGNHHA